MVIEVSYQGASESRDIYAHVKRTDYFETDDMPESKSSGTKANGLTTSTLMKAH